jgi:hypothetical protein
MRFLDSGAKEMATAIADEPTPKAGNRRQRWCIQPIGC